MAASLFPNGEPGVPREAPCREEKPPSRPGSREAGGAPRLGPVLGTEALSSSPRAHAPGAEGTQRPLGNMGPRDEPGGHSLPWPLTFIACFLPPCLPPVAGRALLP